MPLAVWPAPAKINLFLHITGRRDDGYHTLQTAFQFLDYGDSLKFEITDSQDILREDDSDLPATDLSIRAARLLQKTCAVTQGVRITLTKHIPVGAGLGGGSSDAATTLIALNELWQTGLSRTELQQLGLQLGADVPVFVYGKAAWAEGVGEQFSEIFPDERWYCVVKPGVMVNTGQIFSDEELTRNTPEIRIRDFSADRSRNDLEAVTRRLYPEVDEVCRWMSGYGHARMTGSGAAVIVAVHDPETGQDMLQFMPPGCTGFVARSVNRHPLVGRC